MKQIVRRGLPMLLMFVLIIAMSGGTIFNLLAIASETEVPHSVDLSLSPNSATTTVGGSISLRADINNWVVGGSTKVKWNVIGAAVTLYADANCQNAVSLNTDTSTLTVYAKGNSAGTATVIVTSVYESITSASCTVTVNSPSYTVTYKPGAEATGEDQKFNAIDNGQGGYKHDIEKCEDNFTAPEGKHFDHWDDGKGHTYKYGDTINPVTENITLTAIWVSDSKPNSSSGGGSGSMVDLVFNIPGADDSWEYVGGYVPQRAYRVSLAPMQGGSAALGLTTGDSGTALNVYPNSTVYVFPNAEQGYVLDKIVWSLIDGSASYDITEAKNFVMPAMDAVVYVTFRPVG